MEENACLCQPLNEKCSAAACATVHTAGAFGRAKLAPSLFSPPTPPPPPLPTLSSDSCQLATPALSCPPARLPPPPSCPAAVQPSSVCSPDCSSTAAEDDRCQCGQGSRPENSCCTQGGEEEAAEDVVIDCHLLKPSLNNGCLRGHAEVSLQFQGDLLSGAHLP